MGGVDPTWNPDFKLCRGCGSKIGYGDHRVMVVTTKHVDDEDVVMTRDFFHFECYKKRLRD